MTKKVIVATGAGRMGRGIAICFAFAGHRVILLDAKPRDTDEFDSLRTAVTSELEATFTQLADFELMPPSDVPQLLDLVECRPLQEAAATLAVADVIFEAVPETLTAKEQALRLVSQYARKDAIIASTTSTILSDELQQWVEMPARFLNAHWLNPAYLVPLVELSPARETDPAITQELFELLESIGKVPVRCTASPGYIVPRIQALAMNEAARLVEEGVASAEDIDKATRYGFGFRFAVLGLLEFVDWGGGDILYYASRYLSDAMGDERFAAPSVVEENMRQGRTGLAARQGFLDYSELDIPAYQRERLAAFVAMLRHLDKLPVRGES